MKTHSVILFYFFALSVVEAHMLRCSSFQNQSFDFAQDASSLAGALLHLFKFALRSLHRVGEAHESLEFHAPYL